MKAQHALLVAIALGVLAALWYWLGPSGSRASTSRSETVSSGEEGSADPVSPEKTGTKDDRELQNKRAADLSKQAAAMRQEIYKNLWRNAEDGTRHPPTGPDAPPPNAQNLDAEYIQERVRQDFFPMAKQCYEDLLTRDPHAAGKVVLSFRIVGDEKVGGVVDQSEIERDAGSILDPEMETCMRESMSAMTFAPPEHGGVTTITYPILFTPDDPDEGGAK